MTSATGDGPVPAAGDVRTVGPAHRGRWLLLLLLAAGAVGVAARPTWVVADAAGVLDGAGTVTVAGTAAAPQLSAAALVLLAAAGAVTLVGRAGRWVVAVVTVGAGVLVVGAALAVLGDPGAAADGAVSDVTGVVAAEVTASSTPGPTAALVVGAAVAVLGVLLARAGGAWQVRSRRHEHPAASPGTPPAAGHGDERADWDSLTRGDDPS